MHSTTVMISFRISAAFVRAFFAIIILMSFTGLGRYSESKKTKRGLKHHSEIYRAKNLIDTLSSKLHLNLQTYQSKYSSLQKESSVYLAQTNTTKNEIKTLKKLKLLLNELVGKSSLCEKFYSDFDFTVVRPIIIKSKDSKLPQGYTVKLKVDHRQLIDKGLALGNGNDLRVYYKTPAECKSRELDRIVENIATTGAVVIFKLQEDLGESTIQSSTYFLVYGNPDAGEAKHSPDNVYLFYDDFSSSSLEKKWINNWGSTKIDGGRLELKTARTPTGNHGEVAIYAKEGSHWKDIEVELDMMERNSGKYPGPFLRIENPGIKSTSAWWFEYHEGHTECTMRPFKNNKDGSWLYKGTLKTKLAAGRWIHTKYRVVGDRFSHWVDGNIIHNNVKVSSTWMIDKGTLGLGCHNDKPTGCNTLYDNIKATIYVPAEPTISLGTECKVDLSLFHGLGTSETNPATSCKQIHDISLYHGQHRLHNGLYWIKTAADKSVRTYCDLANGGWTLVGKISGNVGNIYKTWLITNQNVNSLSNPALPKSKHISCIDARYLATYHASTIMFASGENYKGIGSKWIQWSLPTNRDSKTLWTHSIGQKTLGREKMAPVLVKAWNGQGTLCYQNKFGIMPLPQHGGSYPSATFNTAGNTNVKDYCMAVGVQTKGTVADGWSQNGNGYDSPQSNSDWPNGLYNHQAPFVTVWLK